jgi:hypothetical protein
MKPAAPVRRIGGLSAELSIKGFPLPKVTSQNFYSYPFSFVAMSRSTVKTTSNCSDAVPQGHRISEVLVKVLAAPNLNGGAHVGAECRFGEDLTEKMYNGSQCVESLQWRIFCWFVSRTPNDVLGPERV